MSIPVGQSRAHPLQERQRSSASWTAGDVQPCEITSPLIISCDSGPAASRVLLLPRGLVRRAHHPSPGCCRRCTCPLRCTCAQRQRRAAAPDQGDGTKIRIRRPRIDHHARVQQIVRIESGLDGGKQVKGGWSTSCPAEPTGHGRRRARPTSIRRSQPPAAQPPRRSAGTGRGQGQRKSIRTYTAVAEVSVRKPLQSVISQQLVEVAEVGTQRGWWARLRPPSPGRPASTG